MQALDLGIKKPVVVTTGFLCRANRKNVEPFNIRIGKI
jgi:hypothetical protein